MAFIYIGCRVIIFKGSAFTIHAGDTCLYHWFFSILQLALINPKGMNWIVMFVMILYSVLVRVFQFVISIYSLRINLGLV